MKKQFAVGQIWLSRDGEQRVIYQIEEGNPFPIYTETLEADGQQVHTAEGRMHAEGEHGGDLVKLIGFAVKSGEAPPSLKSMLEAVAASMGDSEEGEELEVHGCDCAECHGSDPAETLRELTGTLDQLMAKKAAAQEREFADRLILAMAGNPNTSHTVETLMRSVQASLDARKNLKF